MIRVRKQGYVFILTDLKCFDDSFGFLTSICVNNYFETENFFNKLMPYTFCLLGLLYSRQSNGFLP